MVECLKTLELLLNSHAMPCHSKIFVSADFFFSSFLFFAVCPEIFENVLTISKLSIYPPLPEGEGF